MMRRRRSAIKAAHAIARAAFVILISACRLAHQKPGKMVKSTAKLGYQNETNKMTQLKPTEANWSRLKPIKAN
jgi:hypothetical protein